MSRINHGGSPYPRPLPGGEGVTAGARAPVQLSYHRCRRWRWARRALRWLHGNGALLLALLATAGATGAAVWAVLLLGGVL